MGLIARFTGAVCDLTTGADPFRTRANMGGGYRGTSRNRRVALWAIEAQHVNTLLMEGAIP